MYCLQLLKQNIIILYKWVLHGTWKILNVKQIFSLKVTVFNKTAISSDFYSKCFFDENEELSTVDIVNK